MSILIDMGTEIISSDIVLRAYQNGVYTYVETKDRVFIIEDQGGKVYKKFKKACEVLLEKSDEQKS